MGSNYYIYCISECGISHILKNKPCQDFGAYKAINDKWIIAVVADGVGSARHSEIASKMACESVISYFTQDINYDSDSSCCVDHMKKAFIKAEDSIEDYVRKECGSLIDYDTTLHAVLYSEDSLVYGHSGDGGIIALNFQGDFQEITKPQKGEDGICVIPLRAGENSWEFGEIKEQFASVLLATDGVYDTFRPYLLREEPVSLYIPLLRWFMDNNILKASDSEDRSIENSRKEFLLSEATSSITDDKTVLVIVNMSKLPTIKDSKYYEEPDWEALKEKWNKKAYPTIYK